MRNAPNAADALGFDLHFDATKFTFTGCDFTGTALQTWSFKDCSNPAPGVIRVGAFTTVDALPAGANGLVVKVNFNILLCSDGEALALELRQLVDDVASWQTCVGCFMCEHCDGDVNSDGQVTPQDALLDFECFLGKQQCTPTAQVHGDITRDERLTPGDALCIFNEFLGKPPTPDCLCFLEP